MRTQEAEIDTPIGRLRLVVRGETLCSLDFAGRRRSTAGASGAARPLVRRLRAYFAGDLRALDGIAVEPAGTDFERRVWRALLQVRPGQTVTYGELARRAGAPGAARAVGGACGRNPIAVVIPCHRVVGADGSLTGYGGGIERKRWLLRHEAATGRQLPGFNTRG
jgi:methylated-DNA-[protein]-cysteine S-methyltransferase